MIIVSDGRRYAEVKYSSEKDFEDDVVASSRMLFGKDTIYINAKKKIDSKSLGGAIPDGFFFDFGDPAEPQFYIVEVELSAHGFYSHVFPQITKFFAFFKNTKLQKTLVDKIHSVIITDEALKVAFQRYLKKAEIYKFLSDLLESSRNILLVADGEIKELREIQDTYTDTWGKMVRYLEIKKYSCKSQAIRTITHDFETLQYEVGDEVDKAQDKAELTKFDEAYHLDGVSSVTKDVFGSIKSIVSKMDGSLVFNPQKYYISIKGTRNIAFIKVRNKKVRFIAMMPKSEIRKVVKHHEVSPLSATVQRFYNGPCAAVNIQNMKHMDEIRALIGKTVEYNRADGGRFQ